VKNDFVAPEKSKRYLKAVNNMNIALSNFNIDTSIIFPGNPIFAPEEKKRNREINFVCFSQLIQVPKNLSSRRSL